MNDGTPPNFRVTEDSLDRGTRARSSQALLVYTGLAVIQRGISFLILPFITAALSPEQFGAVTSLTAWATLAVALLAAPLEQFVIRTSTRNEAGGVNLLRAVALYSYLWFPIVGVAGAVVALLIGSPLLGISPLALAFEFLAVGLSPAVSAFALPMTRANWLLKRFVAITMVSVVTNVGLKLLFLLPLQLQVLGWTLADLASAIAAAGLAAILLRVPQGRISFAHVIAIFRYAAPLAPHNAAFWALSSLARPLLAIVSSLTAAGLFGLALTAPSIAALILAEINRALLPLYSRERLPAPTRISLGAVRLQTALAFAIPALVASGFGTLGTRLFPESYWASFSLVPVLLLGQIGYGLYLIPMNILTQTAGRTRLSWTVSLLCGASILIGTLTFGPSSGAMAATVSTTIGFALMCAGAFLLLRIERIPMRGRPTQVLSWPLALGAASILLAFIGQLYPLNSVLQLAAGCIAAGVAFGAVTGAWLQYRRGVQVVVS